jgi:hypothetical protein
VIARYEIGGAEMGYDYPHVDTASRRLFVAHKKFRSRERL